MHVGPEQSFINNIYNQKISMKEILKRINFPLNDTDQYIIFLIDSMQ